METVKCPEHSDVSYVTLSITFKFLIQCDLSPPLLSPAIELMYGGIYCFLCHDYIYDKDIEIIAKEEQRRAWKLQGLVVPRFTCLLCLLVACQGQSLSGKRSTSREKVRVGR